jgi:hypothetical protein
MKGIKHELFFFLLRLNFFWDSLEVKNGAWKMGITIEKLNN